MQEGVTPPSLCVSVRAILTASLETQGEGFFCVADSGAVASTQRNTKMKTAKTLLVCAVGLVGGCATTSQMDNANIQIGALESRIARIEKDLYRVEVKSAPKQVVEPKFVPATEVEQNVIDTKIDAFLKEYLGAQFGDSIDLYPTLVCDNDNVRRIQVKKPFGYLDKATGHFEDGKLYSVSFVADIDKKYSEDSVNERIKQTLADLAVSFGMSSDTFSGQWYLGGARSRLLGRRSQSSSSRSSYSLLRYDRWYDGNAVPQEVRRLGAVIENANLRTKLEAEKRARQRAQGEVLPEKKIDAKDDATVEAASVSMTDDAKTSSASERAKRAEKVRRDRERDAMAKEREEMRKQLNSLKEELEKQRQSLSPEKSRIKTSGQNSEAERCDTNKISSVATRLAEAERGVRTIGEACTAYYIQNKKLPTSLDQLTEGEEPILKSGKDLYDPWANKYEMEVKGKKVVIKSAGKDGVIDTYDDIRSDAKKKKD